MNNKILGRALFLLSSILLGSTSFALDQGTLQVTSITPTQTLATANGNFENGWQWIFNVTVPSNETVLKMKFADWTYGTSTIATANNVRFYSPQSLDAYSSSTAKVLTVSGAYGTGLNLNTALDLSPTTAGRQIQVVVDVRVPVGTGGGSYGSSYGINSDLDPNVLSGVVTADSDSAFSSQIINGQQTDKIIGRVIFSTTNEDVKLNTLKLTPSITSTTPNYQFVGLSNIRLLLNGSQVGDTKYWYPENDSSPLIYNFGENFTLLKNQGQTLDVMADILQSASTTNATNTLKLIFSGLSNNAQGYSTNRLISIIPVDFTVSNTTFTHYVPMGQISVANFINPPNNQFPFTINVGETNVVLWSKSLVISNSDTEFIGLTFKNIGSAQMTAISNPKLYIDGQQVGTVKPTNQSDSVFIWEPTGYTISTGAHLVEFKADIVGGQNRNLMFVMDTADNVQGLTDHNFGLTLDLLVNGVHTQEVIYGTQYNISSGSLEALQNSSFTNTSVLTGSTGATLASYKLTAYGENIKVAYLSFLPTFIGTNSNTLTNVGLYVNGIRIGSPMTIQGTSVFTFANFGNSFIIPIGQTVTVEIKGDMIDANANAQTQGLIKIDMLTGNSNLLGVSSNMVFSSTAVSGQTLIVVTGGITAGLTPGSSATARGPGSTNVKIGSFTLLSNPGESLNLNQISIVLDNNMSNQISNLTLKDGNTILGTPIGNPITGSNVLSINLPMAASSTKVLDIYADFGSSASGQVTPSIIIEYLGAFSNLAYTSPQIIGVTTTIASPLITASDVTLSSSSSPVSQLVVGGQSAFNIAAFNIKSSNNVAGSFINDIHFTVPSNTISSVTVNGRTASVVGTNATVYSVGIQVPPDSSGVNIPVAVSTVCVGVINNCAGTSYLPVYIILDALTYNNGTASTTVSGISAMSNNHYLVGSKPYLTVNSTTQNGLVSGAENKIGEVAIAADAGGSININQIGFLMTVSGISSPGVSSLRITNNGVTIPGSSCTSNFICSFPEGFTISAGTTQNFNIYGVVTGTFGSPGGSYVSSSLIKENFRWTDVVGGGNNIDGTAIYNFPTNSYTRTN